MSRSADASTSLTDFDRWTINEARNIAPLLRDGSITERLAAELLARLADLAERLLAT